MSPDRTNVASDQTIVVGVDIGATTIKAGIVNLAGELIESFHQPSPRTPAALRDFVHLVLQQAKTQVGGIGVGCKGIIDTATSRVNSLPGDLHFLEGELQLLLDRDGAGDQFEETVVQIAASRREAEETRRQQRRNDLCCCQRRRDFVHQIARARSGAQFDQRQLRLPWADRYADAAVAAGKSQGGVSQGDSISAIRQTTGNRGRNHVLRELSVGLCHWPGDQRERRTDFCRIIGREQCLISGLQPRGMRK